MHASCDRLGRVGIVYHVVAEHASKSDRLFVRTLRVTQIQLKIFEFKAFQETNKLKIQHENQITNFERTGIMKT